MLTPRPGRAAALLLLGIGGCASEPLPPPDPDFAGEGIEVKVLDADYVEAAGERVPVEDFVLRLRQRLRELPPERRAELWVHVAVDPSSPASDREVVRAVDRLIGELFLMGLRNVKYP